MVTSAPLFSLKHELDASPEAFGELTCSSDALHDPAELNRRLDEDGYLYIRDFFNRDLIQAGRMSIAERLAAEDSLDPAYPVEEIIARTDKVMTYRGDLALNNPRMDRVVYGPELLGFYRNLFGEPVRHFDHTWFRAVSRGQGTPPHCDLVYMSRGTHQLLTCWIPFGNVPLEVGGLMLLENSHKQADRLRTYLEVDVDLYCENRPREVEKVIGKGGWSHPGWLTNNPVSLREKLGGRWLTAEYQMGDFLTFKMTLIHASLDNQTDRIRLSSDTRYQRASQPADPRWVGENVAGHGPRAKQGMIC
ncbi:MAG: phytanoyl-CoA dioxygenase family protein [Verrucomicrobia bacterium]|nr:phytanoyl-CoA dioxygenase family protein [Verrucomicrobiota bacterium]